MDAGAGDKEQRDEQRKIAVGLKASPLKRKKVDENGEPLPPE